MVPSYTENILLQISVLQETKSFSRVHNDVEFIARVNEWVSSSVYSSPPMGESDEQNEARISLLF